METFGAGSDCQFLQEVRIAVRDSTTGKEASQIGRDAYQEGTEGVKLLQREADGGFKIMGLTPSAELVAISMGELGFVCKRICALLLSSVFNAYT